MTLSPTTEAGEMRAGDNKLEFLPRPRRRLVGRSGSQRPARVKVRRLLISGPHFYLRSRNDATGEQNRPLAAFPSCYFYGS